MKRIIKIAAAALLLVIFLALPVAGEKYTFSFDGASEAGEELSEYISSLPPEVRDALPENSGGTDSESVQSYGFSYFWGIIKDSFSKAVLPAVKSFSGLMGIVILCALFRMLSRTIGEVPLQGIFTLVCSLCAALSLYRVQVAVSGVVKSVLETLTSSMLTMVPVMEAVYISSGNAGSAAVASTGMNLMISFAEGLYSTVLFPAANICFLLAVCAAVSGNSGIAFMSKTLRGIVAGVLILVMTLMSFVFALQSGAAGAADSFAARTLRFAIGSYLPIVGGTVSDSFSFLAGSLDVIKRFCGVTGIAVIIISFAAPLLLITANRLSVAAAGALCGMLGCERERGILSEAGSVVTLMLAITVAAAVMFIIALAVFCRTPAAFG